MSTEEEKAPETLQVFAAEDIKMKDVPPGMPAQEAFKQREENLPKEEIEKRQKIMLEYTRLSGRYCPAHKLKSRWVTPDDLDRLSADGMDLVAMCNLPRGKYRGIAALAHSQIDDKDPLRFFVFPDGMVIINPVIIEHTKAPVFKDEGCMTFEDKNIINVPRFNKVTVYYQTLAKDKDEKTILSPVMSEVLNGRKSHIFQHEVSHCNGVYIYDEDYKPESCEWFNDGNTMTEDELKNKYEGK